MLSEVFEITLVAATLATGLVAGVFLTFSDFVMRGLGRAQPAVGIEAMQWINREVYRSLFMVLLIGMSVALLGLAVLGAVLIGGTVAYWLAAAGAFYVLGVMAVTGRRERADEQTPRPCRALERARPRLLEHLQARLDPLEPPALGDGSGRLRLLSRCGPYVGRHRMTRRRPAVPEHSWAARR